MEKSKRISLIKRVVSTVVLAPVVLGAIVDGWNTLALLAVIVSALLSWEWASMVPNKKNAVYTVAYLSASVCAIFYANVGYSLAIMGGTMLFVWYKAKDEEHRRLLTCGVPYIVLGMGSLVWLYVLFGEVITLWFVLAVWSVDIGGYVVGSTLKGPKLAPSISPNKTWSGLLGGMLFAMLTSAATAYFFNRGAYAEFMVLGAVLAVVSQCGDLLESKVKRYLNVKDSSNLIPGHGGIFDRVDGLIFSAPFVLAIFLFFII